MAEVRMDYGAVNNVANGFQQTSEVLHAVSVVLEAAIHVLQATAWISFGATAFAERYLSNIKPRVDRLAASFEEMGGDLRAAIADHQRADSDTAPTFN
jgi:WXG100 family type VII secretion target